MKQKSGSLVSADASSNDFARLHTHLSGLIMAALFQRNVESLLHWTINCTTA